MLAFRQKRLDIAAREQRKLDAQGLYKALSALLERLVREAWLIKKVIERRELELFFVLNELQDHPLHLGEIGAGQYRFFGSVPRGFGDPSQVKNQKEETQIKENRNPKIGVVRNLLEQ